MRAPIRLIALLTLASCAMPAARTDPPRFAVFFEEWSARLDAEATGALSAAAREANTRPNASVQVIGYADPTGSPQANVDISRTRAQQVSDTLVANGVAPVRITRSTRGATNFAQKCPGEPPGRGHRRAVTVAAGVEVLTRHGRCRKRAARHSTAGLRIS